jgi:circadian clock protein KaiC
VQRFSRQGVSVLMTSEIPRLFGAERISDSAVSSLADNIVLLGYQQERDTISWTIAVIKTRASHHDPRVRKFVIGPRGVALDEILPAAEGSSQGDDGRASVPSP